MQVVYFLCSLSAVNLSANDPSKPKLHIPLLDLVCGLGLERLYTLRFAVLRLCKFILVNLVGIYAFS